MSRKKTLYLAVLLATLLGHESCGLTNLVVNGDFESADPTDPRRPLAWALPDGLGVRWERRDDGGRAIWLDTSISEIEMMRQWRQTGLTNLWNIPKPAGNAIADTYGLSYYSEPFAVVSGQVYRVRCDVYGAGAVKVWVRGYGTFRGRLTKRYEAVMNAKGIKDGWLSNTYTFNPTKRRPEVSKMRVMLYAWYPPARYGFDNIVVEAVPPVMQEKSLKSAGSSGRSSE